MKQVKVIRKGQVTNNKKYVNNFLELLFTYKISCNRLILVVAKRDDNEKIYCMY